MRILKEWEALGEMTTHRMSGPSTGGAIQKRVRPEFLDPSPVLGTLEIQLSEDQIPQVVGFIRSE
jgi:hypothetical protein